MRIGLLVALASALLLPAAPGAAQETDTDVPQKFWIEMGGFRVSSSTNLRLNGSAPGDDVDFERDLNLPNTTTQGYLEAFWRIGRRHQVSANWQRVKRDGGSVAIQEDIEWGDVVFPVGVEVQAVAGFTRQGGEPLGDDPAIIDAIFDETVIGGEQISDIIEIDANRSAVFFVTNYEPAKRQPLEDVRDQVVRNIEIQRSEELMDAKADEMLEALANGADFADAAAAIGATAEEPVLMSRNAEGADQFVSVAVFTALKPTQDKPTTGSTRNGVGGFTVFSLDAVIPGRPEVLPVDQRDAGKSQLTDQTGIGDFVAFIKALRESSEIIINEDALAQEDLL